MRALTETILASGVVLSACEGPQQEAIMAPAAPFATAAAVQMRLPFHSEVNWNYVQLPLPAGRCTAPLPAGLSYLWYTELSGTAVSTHLGRGSFAGSICVYGVLTDPTADPPGNGNPTGYQDGNVVFTAADGDQLHARIWVTGFTAPPGTPGWKFIEQGVFVGGTGRFEHAVGAFTGLVDTASLTAVDDGWISF
jgi:hypothetical protein